jgi:hypothetical protein
MGIKGTEALDKNFLITSIASTITLYLGPFEKHEIIYFLSTPQKNAFFVFESQSQKSIIF